MVRPLLIGSLLLLLPAAASAEDLIATYDFNVWWYGGDTSWPNKVIGANAQYFRGPGPSVPALPVGEPSRAVFMPDDYPGGNDGLGLPIRFDYSAFGAFDPHGLTLYPVAPPSDDDVRRVTAIEITITRWDSDCEWDEGVCIVRNYLSFDAHLYAPTVPEPATWLLFVIGGCGAVHRRRLLS